MSRFSAAPMDPESFLHQCMLHLSSDQGNRLFMLRKLSSLLQSEYTTPFCGFLNFALEKGLDHFLVRILRQELDEAELYLVLDCLLSIWSRASTQRQLLSLRHNFDVVHVLVQLFGANSTAVRQKTMAVLFLWAEAKDVRIKSHLVRSGIVERISQESLENDHLVIMRALSTRASSMDADFMYRCWCNVIFQQLRTQALSSELLSSILWNWVVHPRLCIKMIHCDLWNALRIMMRQSLKTRQQAASVLGTMVSLTTGTTDEELHRIVKQQSWLVPNFVEILRQDDDHDIRRRCIRTVRCLASINWGRQLLFDCTSQDELLTTLTQILRNTKDSSDTRCQACQTVACLIPAEDWTALSPCLETIMIRIVETDKSEKLILSACQTLRASFSNSRWQRGTGCFSTTFFRRLLQVLESHAAEPSYTEPLSDLFVQFSSDGLTLTDMISNFGEPILDSLAILVGLVGPDFELSRTNAIKMIASLMEDDRYKRHLVENENLLTSLVNFCLVHRGPQKEQVKQMILNIVPEL